MKILILGSNGQIGYTLSEYLKIKKHDIIEFDITSNSNDDLRIPNILDNILPEIDFVFFLAFDVGGSLYLEKYQNTYGFISNNIKIMDSTFDSLKKYGTPFIFTTSQMSNMLYSSYGVLKKIGEDYTKVLNGMIVKLWNVYGYEIDFSKSHVITDFIIMAKKNNIIKMRTNGIEERQFLYVDDCCECLNVLMDNYNKINKTEELHIANFKWDSVISVAEIISNNFNNCEIIKGEHIDDIQLDKRNEPNSDILKYWSPKTSLIDGISNMINKYNVIG